MMHRTTLATVALAVTLAIGAATSTASALPLPDAPSCPVLPADNPWNQRVDRLPIAAGSAQLVAGMQLQRLHPDFSDSDADGYGIPFMVVDAATPRYSVAFDYADESDPGPYPIPANPRIEQGGDRHLITIDKGSCRLAELFAAEQQADGSWSAGSGATFDLRSNALRPLGWTSADAAGLPIFPGLARFDEVERGVIDHALRITVPVSQRAYVWPARHFASSRTAPSLAPMGLRLRLKASYDISHFGPQTQVLLRAAKTYGVIVADNGSAGFISGAPDPGWDDDDLHALHEVPGRAFEVVDTTAFPRAPKARLWNARVARSSTTVTTTFFHAGAGRVTFDAIRSGKVVRTKTAFARLGVVTMRLPLVSGARYRLRVA